MDVRTCSIEGCDGTYYARGWCEKHYARWRKWGDPRHATIKVAVHDTSDGTKPCAKCRERKPLDQFDNDGEYLAARCKDCRREEANARYQRNKPAIMAKNRRAYQRKAVDPAWRANQTRKALARKYKLTLAEYDAIVASGPHCTLCRKDLSNGARNLWCIDHDHQSGKTRDVLCKGCNTLLGLAKDDPELLERAAAYVRSYRA